MANITTRETGGTAVNRPLTNAELDNNFINLNTDIGTRIPSTEKGSANGVASLDATGKVPTAQLPSYVDDVLEAANLAAFPATGETGKIYVALDTNKTYRWSGSAYVYITSGAVDSVAGKTGVVTLVKGDVGLGSVDNTADSAKNVLSATKLTTARTLGGVSFDGTANINLPGVNAAGNQNTTGTAAGLTDNSSWMLNRGSVAAASVDTATANGFYQQNNVGDSQGLLVFNAGGSLGPLQMTFTYGGLMQFRGKTDSTTWTAWKTVLTSANVSSYALPIGGGTLTGAYLDFSNSTPSLRITSGPGTFFIGDDDLVNLSSGALITTPHSRVVSGVAYLSTYAYGVSQGDNKTHFGYYNGTSYLNYIRGAGTYFDSATLQIAGNQALHAGNYNSYSPTLTGTGASGSWGISVTGSSASTTGNAASATRLINLRTINGVGFDGTANITVADATKLPLTGGTLTGELTIATGAATGLRINTSTGTQSLWVRAGYDSDGTATPVVSATNIQFQSSGSSGGTFTFVSGNTKSLAIGSVVNSLVALQQAGNQVLHAGNVSTYALPIGGGTLTGGLQVGYGGGDLTIRATAANDLGDLVWADYAGTEKYRIWDGTTGLQYRKDGGAGYMLVHTGNYNSYSPTLTGTGASGSWGISVTGNAATATTLQTARTINGTSFNGSANITTANWGTARTLTIGNTGKSVDGSANVAWTAQEIGVLPIFSGQVTISNAGFTNAFFVTGDALASAIRFTVHGTSNGNVIASTIDAVVNHSQDIMITSLSGVYTLLSVKIISNDNDQFVVQLSTNSATATTCSVQVQPLNSESITFTGITAPTGSTLTHVCQPGYAISGTGGNSGDIRSAGTIYAPTFSGALSGNASTVTNGLVSTGSYGDPAWITSLASSKLTGTIDNARLNGGTYTINISGNAGTATTLQTARTINGVSFNGSANITVADSTKLPLTGGNQVLRFDTAVNGEHITFQNQTSGGAIQLGFQQNDTDGLHHRAYFKFYKGSAGTNAGALDIVIRSVGGGTSTDIFRLQAGSAPTWAGSTMLTAANYNTYSPTLTGTGASGTWGISITGNAATATALQTARTIGGVSFNGTANINLPGVNTAGNQNTTGNAATATTATNQSGGTVSATTGAFSSTLSLAGTSTNQFIAGNGDAATLTMYNFALSGWNGMAFYNPTSGGVYANQVSGVVDFRNGIINMKGGFQVNGSTVLHAGNYNSYSPTLTGGGASGSWGISVTGNAATATNISNTGTVTLASATESNSIFITAPSYTTDAPVKLLNFDWYGNVFSMGNIRSGATPTNGFGVYYTPSGGSRSEIARFNTNGTLRTASGLQQGPDMVRPLAQWSATGAATGMVYFEMPGNSTSNYGMVHAVIDIYEYNSNAVSTIIVGGHNWNGAWYNVAANVIGQTDKAVRLGVRGGKYVICIGSAGSSWSYGTVVLRKIHNGGYYTGIMDMSATFVAAITTTESLTSDSGDLRALRTPSSFNAGGAITQAGNQVLHAGNYTSYSPSLTGTGASGSWGISVTGSSASTTGNAATATALQTARTIGGVSFNGTANINLPGVNTAGNQNTTGSAATLTTARTLTIGSTGKTFNGSANVAWTLAEIGALSTGGGTLTSSGSSTTLHISDTGANGANIKLTGDGATTPSKFIRAKSGSLEVLNNAYTAAILQLTDAGNLTATGNITAYSDESLKKDWAPVATDFVVQLASIKHGTYTRIDSGERQAGASAQDWQKLLPETVLQGSDGKLSLAYGNAALVSAIQLAQDNLELRARIDRLESLIEQILNKE